MGSVDGGLPAWSTLGGALGALGGAGGRNEQTESGRCVMGGKQHESVVWISTGRLSVQRSGLILDTAPISQTAPEVRCGAPLRVRSRLSSMYSGLGTTWCGASRGFAASCARGSTEESRPHGPWVVLVRPIRRGGCEFWTPRRHPPSLELHFCTHIAYSL